MTPRLYKLPSSARPWAWGLVANYDPALTEAIKHHIPSRQRRWMARYRQWWFKEAQVETVSALCDIHAGGHRVVS